MKGKSKSDPPMFPVDVPWFSLESSTVPAGMVAALKIQDWRLDVRQPRKNHPHFLGKAIKKHQETTNWIQLADGYGSIPINTIFSGMNIYLPAILMFTRGTRFWHTARCLLYRDRETGKASGNRAMWDTLTVLNPLLVAQSFSHSSPSIEIQFQIKEFQLCP